MSDFISDRGLDPDNMEWPDLAACANQELSVNLFFDDYERSPQIAAIVDAMCDTCPVKNECLNEAIDNEYDGVWGGVYLKKGHYDPARNKHKTKEEQEFLEDYIG